MRCFLPSAALASSAFAAGPPKRSVAYSVAVPWQSWHWIWIAAWYSE